MHKQGLALNSLQGLIYHKTQQPTKQKTQPNCNSQTIWISKQFVLSWKCFYKVHHHFKQYLNQIYLTYGYDLKRYYNKDQVDIGVMASKEWLYTVGNPELGVTYDIGSYARTRLKIALITGVGLLRTTDLRWSEGGTAIGLETSRPGSP